MGCCLDKFYTEDQNKENGRPEIHLVTSAEDVTTEHKLQQEQTEHQASTVVALYDYSSRDAKDIDFKKRDKFTLISKQNADWWLVTHTKTGEEGYVPSNFVCSAGTFRSEEWFFGTITRKDSERLLSACRAKGCFLVRESETSENSYSLSLLNEEESRGRYVKHYRIRCNGKGSFYITEDLEFDKLQSLIEFYHEDSHGLCCRLVEPCSTRDTPQILSLAPNVADIEENRVRFLEELEKCETYTSHKGIWNEKAILLVKEYTFKVQPGVVSEMRKLHHKTILKFFGSISTRPACLCWEYMDGGNLSNYLQNNSNLPLVDLVDAASQIATGMAYLEAARFPHRYLRSRHVAVGTACIFKVADYGIFESPLEADSDAFLWLSPEAIQEQQHDIKSDVWSFGILTTEIVSNGDLPYSGSEERTALVSKLVSGYRMPKHDQCPEALYEFLLQCWDQERDLRPTFEYIQIFLESYFQRADVTDST